MFDPSSFLNAEVDPSKYLVHNRVFCDLVVSSHAYGDDYPLESFVFVKWFGVPFSREIQFKGRTIEKGSSRTRTQAFFFHFQSVGVDGFVLTVNNKKGFINLPKELRAIILQTTMGPKRYGVSFKL